jgi:glycosyltransferase involved in cell wall biosynthesis
MEPVTTSVKPGPTSHETDLIPVTVVIHAKNEEINIPYALPTVCGKFVKVFVVDAGSSDRTREIAESFGATVVRIQGDRSTLVKQRNWALANLPFETEWVFILDCDEWLPDDLLAEIRQTMKGPPPPNIDGYWIRAREIILGKWVKRAAIYPNWSFRLFRHAVIRYEDRTVNSHPLVKEDRGGRLQAQFIHDDHRGFASYIQRLAGITTLEAKGIEELYSTEKTLMKASLFSPSFQSRRRAMKKIFYRLPLRPIAMFLMLYVVRGGFLEGRPGLYAALHRAIHELFIDIIRYEQRSVKSYTL